METNGFDNLNPKIVQKGAAALDHLIVLMKYNVVAPLTAPGVVDPSLEPDITPLHLGDGSFHISEPLRGENKLIKKLHDAWQNAESNLKQILHPVAVEALMVLDSMKWDLPLPTEGHAPIVEIMLTQLDSYENHPETIISKNLISLHGKKWYRLSKDAFDTAITLQIDTFDLDRFEHKDRLDVNTWKSTVAKTIREAILKTKGLPKPVLEQYIRAHAENNPFRRCEILSSLYGPILSEHRDRLTQMARILNQSTPSKPTHKKKALAEQIGAQCWQEIEIKVLASGIGYRQTGTSDNFVKISWGALGIKNQRSVYELLIKIAQYKGTYPKEPREKNRWSSVHVLNSVFCDKFGFSEKPFRNKRKLGTQSIFGSIFWGGMPKPS